jgi:raffinose/stachyose/melibiose transport system substrate-binding protein
MLKYFIYKTKRGSVKMLNFFSRFSRGREIVLLLFLFLAASVGLSARTLTIVLYRPGMLASFQELAHAFTKAHPDIRIRTKVTHGYHGSRLIQEAAYGNLPDIIQAPAYRPDFELAINGYAADLNRLRTVHKVNPDILSGVTFQGGIIALPTAISTLGVFYNRSIFQRLNLSVPRTFKELQNVTKVLRDNGITPFASLLKDNQSLGEFLEFLHSAMLSTAGWGGATGAEAVVQFATAMDNGETNWGSAVDEKKLFHILKWYAQQMSPLAVHNGLNQEVAEFASGQAAMVFQQQDFVLTAQKAEKALGTSFSIGAFPFPWSNNPNDNKFASTAESSFVISTQSSAGQQRAAREFLNFLASPEAIHVWTDHYKLLPAFHNVPTGNLPQAFQDIVVSEDRLGSDPWEFVLCPGDTWRYAMQDGARRYLDGQKSAEEVSHEIDWSWKDHYHP